MIAVVVFVWLTSTGILPTVHKTNGANPPNTYPVLVEGPKSPNGLTLYNEKGEVVARCGKKDETFHDCKMESGVTLDDLMNAWVHAYLEVQK
jgi:hypothetical protein